MTHRQHQEVTTSRFTKWLIGILITFLISCLLTLILFLNSGMTIFHIKGESMEPTFHDGDSQIIQKEDPLTIGTIAFFKFPITWPNHFNEDSILVKRVVAIGGDTITFDGQKFTVNGTENYPLPSTFTCSAPPQNFTYTLSDQELFMMGDNAAQSMDSRWIYCQGQVKEAFVNRNLLVNYGRVVWKF